MGMYMQEKFVEGNKRNLTLATSAECKWAHFIEYPHMLLDFLFTCVCYIILTSHQVENLARKVWKHNEK